ncbi:uncharacterized protein V2V93DRAFT_369575 [Kockiozyma suomiensis]|uniref:uncharacterized protein n=1 Tax=Kockiozyma suomiensis TaxID=1337062 RepID=UPI003342F8F1
MHIISGVRPWYSRSSVVARRVVDALLILAITACIVLANTRSSAFANSSSVIVPTAKGPVTADIFSGVSISSEDVKFANTLPPADSTQQLIRDGVSAASSNSDFAEAQPQMQREIIADIFPSKQTALADSEFLRSQTENVLTSSSLSQQSAATTASRKKKVFLVNSERYHFEVVMPVLNTFSQIEDIDLTLFSTKEGRDRFGVKPLLKHFARNANSTDFSTIKNLVKPSQSPDLIFLTTCGRDIANMGDTLTKFLENGAHVMCVIHESHRWDQNDIDQRRSIYKKESAFMIPWIKNGQWKIVTLSNHVQRFIHANFPSYLNTGTEIDYSPSVFFPVFDLPESRIYLDINKPSITLAGKFEESRRSYKRIFDDYIKVSPPVSLNLIGSMGNPKIPRSIKNKVSLKYALDFKDYFKEIAKSIAILPAFATPDYIHSQASSSVATSVISITPPIMTREMLAAYDYISEDAAWIQEEGESEMETVTRIINSGYTIWWEKKQKMRALKDEMMSQNMAVLRSALYSI